MAAAISEKSPAEYTRSAALLAAENAIWTELREMGGLGLLNTSSRKKPGKKSGEEWSD
jgi:hypothetical protein